MRKSYTMILVMGCGLASAQVLVERGAATAGAIGSAAGAGIGRSMGKIFQNTDDALNKAGKTAEPVQRPQTKMKVTAELPADQAPLAPRANAAPRPRAATDAAVAQDASAPAAAEPAAPVAATTPPPPPEPNLEALTELKVGATRKELIDKVGSNAMKLSFNDGSHLVEVFRYRTKAEEAVVKLEDGIINSIERLAR